MYLPQTTDPHAPAWLPVQVVVVLAGDVVAGVDDDEAMLEEEQELALTEEQVNGMCL